MRRLASNTKYSTTPKPNPIRTAATEDEEVGTGAVHLIGVGLLEAPIEVDLCGMSEVAAVAISTELTWQRRKGKTSD